MIDIIAIDQLSVTVIVMLLITETIWRQLRKWVVLFYFCTIEDQPFFSLNAGLFFSHQVVL